jgi:protein-tyrosine phosphatase
MFSSVLVVCVGNICRSPLGERLLAQSCPNLRIESAGIGALVGHAADKTASEVAASHGVSLEGHVARQFTSELAADFDLIIVLEKGHKRVVVNKAPEVSGKTMLFGQWVGQKDIADPYRKSREFHEEVFQQIKNAADGWVEKLNK